MSRFQVIELMPEIELEEIVAEVVPVLLKVCWIEMLIYIFIILEANKAKLTEPRFEPAT